MRESSIVVRPQPMESATYTASSRLQASGLDSGIRLFEQAARTVPLPKPPQSIAIADYGAATGYNSLLPVGAAVLEHRLLVGDQFQPAQTVEDGFHRRVGGALAVGVLDPHKKLPVASLGIQIVE